MRHCAGLYLAAACPHDAPVTERSEAPAAAGSPWRERHGLAVLMAVVVLAAAFRDPASWPEGALLVDASLMAALAWAAVRRQLVAWRGQLLVLAVVVGLVATARAADLGGALSALQHEARLMGAFWLGASFVAGAGTRRGLAWALAVSVALASVHGAWQVLVSHPALVAADPGMPAMQQAQLLDGRANSVFILPAHLGSWAAAALVASLALALEGKGRQRTLALFACVLHVAALGLSGSIGGLLLAAIGASAVILVRLPPRLRFLALAAGAMLALMLLLASAVRRQAEIDRETPWEARARNWAAAMRLIREEPLTGHGPGSFGTEHARVRAEVSNDVQHAHQTWLQAGAEQGLLLPILLAFLVMRAARGWLRMAWERDGGALALAVAAAVLVAESLIDFGWMTTTWGLPAALVVGASFRNESAPLGSPRGWRAGLAALAAAALLVADAAIAVSGLRAEAARERVMAGRLDEAHDLLTTAARLQPLDDRRWRELASIELLLARGASGSVRDGLLSDASAHARRATAASARKAAGHALLSTILSEQGHAGAAAAAALRAWELAPWDLALREARDEALRRAGLEGP